MATYELFALNFLPLSYMPFVERGQENRAHGEEETLYFQSHQTVLLSQTVKDF